MKYILSVLILCVWMISSSNCCCGGMKNKTKKGGRPKYKRPPFPDDSNETDYHVAGLEYHNDHRALHGVPPLTLDEKLNKDAQEYADYLAKRGGAPVHGTAQSRHGAGENIYYDTVPCPGKRDPTEYPVAAARFMTSGFYGEIEVYDWDRPVFAVSTGHFTQLVWRATTKFGVGLAHVPTPAKTVCMIYGVARYFPPGNQPGQFRETVPKQL